MARERALRGSIEAKYLLKLPADLDKGARADAKRKGISVADWWRQAGQAMLGRNRRAVAAVDALR